MQRESNWRYYFIAAVAILCLLFIYPTLRYVSFVFTQEPPQKQQFETPEAYEAALDKFEDTRGKLQREAIGLGLDLIGGVDVRLQINEAKTRENSLENMRLNLLRQLRDKMIGVKLQFSEKQDALRLSVDDTANARQVANIVQEYVDSNMLQAINVNAFQRTGETLLKLNENYLSRELRSSIEGAERTIRDRVNQFGVTQPSVSVEPETYSIRVQVPGEKDPDHVIAQMIRPAQLEFYRVKEDSETLVQQYYEEQTVTDDRGVEETKFVLREGAQLPPGWKGMTGVRGEEGKGGQMVYKPIMYIVRQTPEMTGENLADAYADRDMNQLGNQFVVSLSFNPQGAREFAIVTRENLEQRLAIALDGKIFSAPVIQTVINGGRAQITGNFTLAEARDLALVLKAGALPADLKPVRKVTIGPSLGAGSIRDSVRALAIGAIGVSVFMIIYYAMAGFMAIIALILNVLVILACLDLFNATLTLSGIGGMILTLGMAVDANVLIYERIREELLAGRSLRNAIQSGFGRAFSVIFDSNLTTLLAALVLLQFGEGSVRGFALTMVFGLVANLFTGLTVTYALCQLWFRMRGKLSLGVLYLFKNPKIDFIAMRKFSFALSIVLVVGSIGFLAARGGPQYAVDFQGGVLNEVQFTDDAPDMDRSSEIKNALAAAGLPGDQAKVQKIMSGTAQRNYLVRVALQDDPETSSQTADVEYTGRQVAQSLRDSFGADAFEILSTNGVSREVGQGFREIALFVVVAASLCILIYLWFRFELVFGMAAVVALVHDLTITLGIISLCGVQISLDVVSALLILLGFSVNDTIVIFDRVRENSHTMVGHPFKEICNRAMNQSLSRTFITSLTTIGVMVVMFMWGGPSLAPFALTLIVGGLVGTYSSDFVATPFVYWWNERDEGRLMKDLSRKTAPSKAPAAPVESPQAATAVVGAEQPQRRGRR